MEFVLGIGIGILNILHAATRIFGGDSAEYSFVARTFTLAHPPGYPFYSLSLNLLRMLLPGMQEFSRNALLSALPTGLTAGLTYLLLRRLRIAPFIALTSVSLFTFSLPVWTYALVPEVFALNLLFMVATTMLIADAAKKNNPVTLRLAFLLMGLSVSHHHTAVLFLPGWLYLLRKSTSLIKRQRVALSLLFFVGTSFYLYAPLSSRFSGWFDIENAQTLSGFLRLITRASYGTFKAYSASAPDFNNQVFILFSSVLMIIQDFKPLGFVLMVVGGVLTVRSTWWRPLFLLFWGPLVVFLFITNFVLNASFTISTFERFLLPLYWIGALLIAHALSWIHAFYLSIVYRFITNRPLLVLARVAFVAVTLLYSLILFLQNYPTIQSLRTLPVFQQYADDILKTPPPGSILLIQGDTPLFTVQYQYYLSHVRPDIYFIQPGLLNRSTYIAFLKKYYGTSIKLPTSAVADLSEAYRQFINANSDSRHIYSNTKQQLGYWFPYGLLWKYNPSEEQQTNETPALLGRNADLWRSYAVPQSTRATRNIPYLQNVIDSYTDMQLAYALHLVVLDKIERAKSVLVPLSKKQPQFYDVRASLLGIFTLERNCSLAHSEYNAIPEWYFYKAKLNLNIAINYINTCKDSSARSRAIQKYYTE